MTVEKIIPGTEIVFDGLVWGIVDEIVDEGYIVIDQEGGDHFVNDARIDAILD
jgi:hypothetical protein